MMSLDGKSLELFSKYSSTCKVSNNFKEHTFVYIIMIDKDTNVMTNAHQWDLNMRHW